MVCSIRNPQSLHPAQALGGRFSSALPSDILRPGAFANHSVPARARLSGREFAPLYGNSSELRKISTLMAQCASSSCDMLRLLQCSMTLWHRSATPANVHTPSGHNSEAQISHHAVGGLSDFVRA